MFLLVIIVVYVSIVVLNNVLRECLCLCVFIVVLSLTKVTRIQTSAVWVAEHQPDPPASRALTIYGNSRMWCLRMWYFIIVDLA